MTEITSSTISLNGESCRVLEKGTGERVGFLAGIGGIPTWMPFLDRLAEHRTVVVPSLPGFPGGGPSEFRTLDGQLDWLRVTLDLLEESGLYGCDLIASSVAGMLAADVAAFSPEAIRKLVLIDSWGLYDTDDPGQDFFAQLDDEVGPSLANDQERLTEAMAAPEGTDPIEWGIAQVRANEAAARISWPMGDRGLAKRLYRIRQPTLILWGEDDAILPVSYAQRFADGIAGDVETRTIPQAGHLSVIDQPDVTADHVLSFLGVEVQVPA